MSGSAPRRIQQAVDGGEYGVEGPAFEDASGAVIFQAISIAANTESIANKTLEKIFRILTWPENAALLKRVADDARSFSSLPLARNVIERDEDAQAVFEGRESIPGDRSNYNDVYRRSNRARNPTKPDKGKGSLIEDPSLETEILDSTDVASALDFDRSSFVTARSKIIPSIRSILGSRNASVRSNGSLNSTLYGASTIQRAPQTQRQPQAQAQFEMQTPVNYVHTRNFHEVSDEGATRKSMDELQDEQKARWEYLMELSPHQIFLDQTIDEYEETEKEFEERAKSLKAQISGLPHLEFLPTYVGRIGGKY
ncbi:hypothetical protein V500_02309 [Pseudogymnoascus sp. VKM F-4518 (FW-2643)]|nr:hypothetical protein V500_02309 [Pseudogymnoascus sp. VKM F-4518 (FW-2643)]